MRQLPLDIATEPARSFDSFVPGQNGHAIAHLRQVARQTAPVFLWGASGVGKTHLLHAAASLVQQQGGRVSWFEATQPLPWSIEDTVQLVVLDNCDQLDEARQHAAFAQFIEATTHGIPVLGAARVPPVDLPVRDDLRTRLGWGHVFAVQPLSEPEARAAMRREADRRGLFLSDEVMGYLLTHFDRDLKHLMMLLDRLDEFALVHKRAITVPLLKQMLTEEGP
jgi:DnaA family protein